MPLPGRCLCPSTRGASPAPRPFVRIRPTRKTAHFTVRETRLLPHLSGQGFRETLQYLARVFRFALDQRLQMRTHALLSLSSGRACTVLRDQQSGGQFVSWGFHPCHASPASCPGNSPLAFSHPHATVSSRACWPLSAEACEISDPL